MDDTPTATKEQRAALRHPEKAHRPDNPIQRKPEWIRVKAPTSAEYHETRRLMRELKLAYPKHMDLAVPTNLACGRVTQPQSA